MEGQVVLSMNGTPLFDETNYASWSVKMKVYLKSVGSSVWDSVVSGYTPPKRAKFAAQKDSRKNNSMAMQAILDGLAGPLKEKLEQCTSAKELWDQLQDSYSKKASPMRTIQGDQGDDEEEESFDEGRNEILFLALEDKNPEEESEEEEEGVVDLEAELVAALEEIQNLRNVIKKKTIENKTIQAKHKCRT